LRVVAAAAKKATKVQSPEYVPEAVNQQSEQVPEEKQVKKKRATSKKKKEEEEEPPWLPELPKPWESPAAANPMLKKATRSAKARFP
jgi:hypothetical protein